MGAEEGEDFDPFGEPPKQAGSPNPSTKPDSNVMELAKAIELSQKPFHILIEDFHRLFWELPNLTTRQVDQKLVTMFDVMMECASVVGISRGSFPGLKECCGKKRTWPDEKVSVVNWVYVPIGDGIAWLAKLVGFRKPCEGCERRRAWLNRVIPVWRKGGEGK